MSDRLCTPGQPCRQPHCPFCDPMGWPDGDDSRARARLVRLSDVQRERISWLWPGYLARGKLHVIDGDPGLGKSTIGFDLAARLTTGSPWPDGTPGARGGVVIMSAEDGLSDTIRPRLDAHGADVSQVVALTAVHELDQHTGELRERLPHLSDLDAIRHAAESVGAALLIIDPLTAYLPPGVDAFKDSDVRRVLAPLATLAERLDLAVVIVRHLRKSGGKAIYSGGGSIGIIGAARVGFIVGQHPDEDGRCVFAVSKINIAAKAPTLAYRMVADELHGCGRIVWEGRVDLAADDLTDRDAAGGRSEASEAREWLIEYLTAAGGSALASEVLDAAKAAGLSVDAVKKARRKVAESSRQGFGKGATYTWRLTMGAMGAMGARGSHLASMAPMGAPMGESHESGLPAATTDGNENPGGAESKPGTSPLDGDGPHGWWLASNRPRHPGCEACRRAPGGPDHVSDSRDSGLDQQQQQPRTADAAVQPSLDLCGEVV